MVDVLKVVRDRIKMKYSKKETKTTEKEKFTCPLCRLNFDSEEKLKKHKRQYHKY